MQSKPKNPPYYEVEADKVNALANACYEDVFGFLGLHEFDKEYSVIRVYKPGAKAVSLVNNQHKTAFLRYQLSSFFYLLVPTREVSLPVAIEIDYGVSKVTSYDSYSFASSLDADAMYLFNQGTLAHAHLHLGAHAKVEQGVEGIRFCVWAPNAKIVALVGDFNHWDNSQHVMRKHPASGVWELFIPGLVGHHNYKYSILTAQNERIEKACPYAWQMQLPPHTASVCNSDHEQLEKCAVEHSINRVDQAISIYEVHLGSWRRKVEEGNRYLTYQELADELIPYVKSLGFTHIQLMPVSEFPFDGSWGYQPIGMFAPTSRFGDWQQFKLFVERIKAEGLGVLIDWVPGHFPSDPHGLAKFDGTHLYEHADKRQGYHPDWHTHIYNYDRAEVRSFLLSNATYWLEQFPIDGLRVDAVASMLYLDYSRNEGEWIANSYGGRENLGAISLLQQINSHLYSENNNIMMVAEESTAWPGVTNLVEHNGLGFGYKWNMGWMNDSLRYMSHDPIYRKHHHNEMTFSLVYAFSENYILPLSHDEVVHGKGSLINKMPGDDWQKFANLRAFYAYMWAHPGKKLLFMGCEFAQYDEWNHDKSLDWHLLNEHKHHGMQSLIKNLNTVYKATPALYKNDNHPSGFQWIDGANAEQSIFSFVRFANNTQGYLVCVSNMTPSVHEQFRLGVPFNSNDKQATLKLVLNTDAEEFGGSGVSCAHSVAIEPVPSHGFSHSIVIKLAPLASYYLVKES